MIEIRHRVLFYWHFVNPLLRLRQGSESGGEVIEETGDWIPACAGMTGWSREIHLLRNAIVRLPSRCSCAGVGLRQRWDNWQRKRRCEWVDADAKERMEGIAKPTLLPPTAGFG